MRAAIRPLAALIPLLLVGCAATQSPSAATGQPPRPAGGHGQKAFIGSFDGNRDGVVTRAEYDAIRKQRFDSADKNGDGFLSEEEYVAEYELRLKQQYLADGREPDAAYAGNIKQAHVRFALLDRDRDGRLSREEDLAIADKTFKAQDTNGDGVVSAADPQKAPAGDGATP